MSLSNIQQIIETEIAGAGFTLAGSNEIKWFGVSNNAKAPYISVMIEDAGTIPCVANVSRRYLGNIIFDLHTQQDTGVNAQRVTADQIINHFGNQLINQIQYGSPTGLQSSSEMYRVIIPFYTDR